MRGIDAIDVIEDVIEAIPCIGPSDGNLGVE